MTAFAVVRGEGMAVCTVAASSGLYWMARIAIGQYQTKLQLFRAKYEIAWVKTQLETWGIVASHHAAIAGVVTLFPIDCFQIMFCICVIADPLPI